MYAKLYSFVEKITPAWIFSRVIGRWNIHGLKRYSGNALWALIARTFNMFTSFFVTIYLVRYLGPENYGNLSYALSFVSLFGIISTLGLDNVLYRDLIKFPQQRHVYLGTAFTIRFIAGITAGILASISAFFIAEDKISQLMIVILSATFVFTAFNVIVNEFQANVAQKYPSFVTLIVVLILNASKLIVIISGQGILYLAGVFLLEPILYAIFFSYIRVKHYGSFNDWKFDKNVAYSLLYDSWPFIFISVFMAMYSSIDQVMLKHIVNSHAVGIYDAALRISEAWLFLPSIIASSLFPAIVNAKKISVHEYRARLLTMLFVFVTMAIIVALPLSIFSKQIISIFYGTAFSGSAIVFAIYVWVSVWAVIDIVTRNFLLVENMRKTIFFMTVMTAIVNTILNFIFIPIWGPVGAAWSTFIAYSLFSIPSIMIWRLK